MNDTSNVLISIIICTVGTSMYFYTGGAFVIYMTCTVGILIIYIIICTNVVYTHTGRTKDEYDRVKG